VRVKPGKQSSAACALGLAERLKPIAKDKDMAAFTSFLATLFIVKSSSSPDFAPNSTNTDMRVEVHYSL
jgi:hypothetical protein